MALLDEIRHIGNDVAGNWCIYLNKKIEENKDKITEQLDRIEAKISDKEPKPKLEDKAALGFIIGCIWRKRKEEAVEQMLKITNSSKEQCEEFANYWDKKFNCERDGT